MGCSQSSNVVQNSHKLQKKEPTISSKAKNEQKSNFLIGNVNENEYLFGRVSLTNRSINRLTIPHNFKPRNHSSMLSLPNHKYFICGGIDYSLADITSDAYTYHVNSHTVQKKSSMNQSRYTHTSICVNGFVYVFGGRYFGEDQEAILSECQKYSLQVNQWMNLPKLNIKRCTAYAIEWMKEIYVFGGYTGKFQRSQKIQKLSQKQNTWQIIDFSLNRGIQSAFIVSFEPNKIVIFGGNTNLGQVSSVITLDFKQKTIISNKSLHEQKFLHKSFAFENKVYIFGGSQSLDLEIYDYYQHHSQVVDLQLNQQFKLENFQTLTHSQASICLQEAQTIRYKYSSQEDDDLSLLFGNTEEPFILQFNSNVPFAQKCSIPFSLKLNPFSGGVKISKQEYLIFGGLEQEHSRASSHVYLYNHKECKAKLLSEMITPRYAFSYVKHKNIIFVIGGCNYDQNGVVRIIDAAQSYDIKLDRWKKLSNFPSKIMNSICIVHLNALYVLGGKINEIQYNESIVKYDENTDKWGKINYKIPQNIQCPLIFQRNSHEFYLFGGKNKAGHQDIILKLKFNKEKEDDVQMMKVGSISEKKCGFKVFKPEKQQFLVILGGQKDLISHYDIENLNLLKWDGLSHAKNIFQTEIAKINSRTMQRYLMICERLQY